MRYDDVDDPNYNDTNCGPAMAGYTTPDEKEIERLEARVKELEREADVAKQRLRDNYDISVGQYWSWQGDGEDHLESLTCPIVIQPETMRNLLQSAQQLAEMVERYYGSLQRHSVASKRILAKAREVLEKIK